MLVFRDQLTGNELFSDANKLKLVDGLYYEVYAKVSSENTGIDERLLGANPSAEDAAEQTLDSVIRGIDVVLANRLVQTFFDKKSFGDLIKGYFKKALDTLEKEGVEDFPAVKAKAAAECKKMYSNYKDMEFWLGESMEPEGLIGISYYTSDTEVTMVFFKFGLKVEKF